MLGRGLVGRRGREVGEGGGGSLVDVVVVLMVEEKVRMLLL